MKQTFTHWLGLFAVVLMFGPGAYVACGDQGETYVDVVIQTSANSSDETLYFKVFQNTGSGNVLLNTEGDPTQINVDSSSTYSTSQYSGIRFNDVTSGRVYISNSQPSSTSSQPPAVQLPSNYWYNSQLALFELTYFSDQTKTSQCDVSNVDAFTTQLGMKVENQAGDKTFELLATHTTSEILQELAEWNGGTCTNPLLPGIHYNPDVTLFQNPNTQDCPPSTAKFIRVLSPSEVDSTGSDAYDSSTGVAKMYLSDVANWNSTEAKSLKLQSAAGDLPPFQAIGTCMNNNVSFDAALGSVYPKRMIFRPFISDPDFPGNANASFYDTDASTADFYRLTNATTGKYPPVDIYTDGSNTIQFGVDGSFPIGGSGIDIEKMQVWQINKSDWDSSNPCSLISGSSPTATLLVGGSDSTAPHKWGSTQVVMCHEAPPASDPGAIGNPVNGYLSPAITVSTDYHYLMNYEGASGNNWCDQYSLNHNAQLPRPGFQTNLNDRPLQVKVWFKPEQAAALMYGGDQSCACIQFASGGQTYCGDAIAGALPQTNPADQRWLSLRSIVRDLSWGMAYGIAASNLPVTNQNGNWTSAVGHPSAVPLGGLSSDKWKHSGQAFSDARYPPNVDDYYSHYTSTLIAAIGSKAYAHPYTESWEAVKGPLATIKGGSKITLTWDAQVHPSTDLNQDCIIDIDDLLNVIEHWGSPGGDVNSNGETDIDDLLLTIEDWGETCE